MISLYGTLTTTSSDIYTHFYLRTDQVQEGIGPQPLALVDLPAYLLATHAAKHAHLLARQWMRRRQLYRLCHVRQ